MVAALPERCYRCVALVLQYGCQRRELAHNAAAGMKKVARQHKEMQTYTPAEINRVLEAAGKDRNGHLLVAGAERFAAR